MPNIFMNEIEVRVPDEIKDYAEKFKGFTWRQWIGIIIIAVICVPFYFWTNSMELGEIGIFLTCLIGIVVGCVFFVKFNDLPFEQYVFYWKRNYVEFFQVLEKQTDVERLVNQEMKKDKGWQKRNSKVQKLKSKGKSGYEMQTAVADLNNYQSRLRSCITEYVHDGQLVLTKSDWKQIRKIMG